MLRDCHYRTHDGDDDDNKENELDEFSYMFYAK